MPWRFHFDMIAALKWGLDIPAEIEGIILNRESLKCSFLETVYVRGIAILLYQLKLNTSARRKQLLATVCYGHFH